LAGLPPVPLPNLVAKTPPIQTDPLPTRASRSATRAPRRWRPGHWSRLVAGRDRGAAGL